MRTFDFWLDLLNIPTLTLQHFSVSRSLKTNTGASRNLMPSRANFDNFAILSQVDSELPKWRFPYEF